MVQNNETTDQKIIHLEMLKLKRKPWTSVGHLTFLRNFDPNSLPEAENYKPRNVKTEKKTLDKCRVFDFFEEL